MFKRVSLSLVSALLLLSPAWAVQEDREGSKDHPLLTRMPNFYISEYEEKEFDTHEFEVGSDKYSTVEGHKWIIGYSLKEGAKAPGMIQVVRNYENAIKKIGGTVLYDTDHTASLKLEKQSKEIWVDVHVFSDAYDYKLTIIEKEAMKQDVEANAPAWLSEISATGHAAVYGIYFDTDQADIKPESEPALKEIASLLRNNPALNLYVVGHTDSTGELAHNMNLSEARAKAVMNELVSQYGIAASRLKAYGVGPLAPVASNKDEEGRAKNRRVELVER
jgi:OOP family OmpA-OmpF porin